MSTNVFGVALWSFKDHNEISDHPMFVAKNGLHNYKPVRFSLHKHVIINGKKVQRVTKSSVVGIIGVF